MTATMRADRAVLHRWVVAGLLAVWPWLVAPGLVQPDTKLDLTVSPWRYLARALSAWSTHTGVGELQNQAHGYLFPMGPVMGLAHSAGVPAWGAQRIWWALVLVVGYLGAERLARRLGVASGWAAVLAGVAYTLSPRVLTVLAEISVEAWPGALAPWLVLAARPMVASGAGRRERRLGAVRAGALAACLGGVNATASMVVLVLPVLWLLTAPPGRSKGRAVVAWVAGGAAGSLWWLTPLFVLGRYGYPFLDFIESAATTTTVASVSNVLRGTQHWVAWILTAGDHPTWQGGWVLAQYVPAVVATCVVAGLGLAGLLRLPAGHVRRWSLAAALLAVLAMTIGHAGTAGAPFAGAVQELLDGPLAALRNVHKADPLLRLPVSLGLGALAGSLASAARTRGPRGLRPVSAAVAVLLATGATLPVWLGRVGDAWAYAALPGQWRAVASQVDADAAVRGGSTLLLPGSRVAAYGFGRPNDEPLSALAVSPVLVRASAPLGHPGVTRLLDAIDTTAARGRADPALAPVLARLGVARVVVRHDLTVDAEAASSSAVEQTMSASPGLTRSGGVAGLSVWRVDTYVPDEVTTYPAEGMVRVQGGPEALLPMARAGVLVAARPTALATLETRDDPSGADGAPLLVTDTLRRSVFNAGRAIDRARGATLAPGDDRGPASRRDLPPAGPDAVQPVRRYDTMRSVVASTSASDPFAGSWRGAGVAAFAAVDGDPDTAWLADPDDPLPSLVLNPVRPTVPGPLTVALPTGPGTALPRLVRIRADARPAVTRTVPANGVVTGVDLGAVPIRSLRIELVGGVTSTDRLTGVAEVDAMGIDGSSAIAVPSQAASTLAGAVLERDPRGATGEDGPTWRRLVDLAAPLAGPLRVAVVPRSGTTLDAVLDAPWRVTSADGRDRAELEPAWRPGAAVDGDPRTSWRPVRAAATHRLVVDLGTTRTVTGVGLAGAVGGTRSVLVIGDGGTALLSGRGGTVTPLTTRRITLEFTPVTPTGWVAPEVTLHGVPVDRPDTLSLPCGAAGSVTIDGSPRPLALTASRAELLGNGRLRARVCGSDTVRLAAGRHSVTAEPDAATVESITMLGTAPAPGVPRTTRVVTWTSTRRTVEVGGGPAAVLTLAEGFNAGWRATDAAGRTLAPIEIDGWRQGFELPAGSRTVVTIAFAPAAAHTVGLAVGGGVALALIALASVGLLRGRRPVPPPAGHRAEGGPAPHASPVFVVLSGVGAAALSGFLVAGPVGLLAGVVGGLTPRRAAPTTAVAAMLLCGTGLSALGVAGRDTAGAFLGQALGCVVLGLVASALVGPGSREAAARPPGGGIRLVGHSLRAVAASAPGGAPTPTQAARGDDG